MRDPIERADAIRAIKRLRPSFDFDDVDAYDKAKDNCDDYAVAIMDAIDAVDDILSAN